MPVLSKPDPLQAAIEQAKQQQAAENMMRQVLTQALNKPARIVRLTGPKLMTMGTDPDGNKVLLVAQVTGERLEIPIDDATGRRLAYAWATSGTEDPATPAAESEDPVE